MAGGTKPLRGPFFKTLRYRSASLTNILESAKALCSSQKNKTHKRFNSSLHIEDPSCSYSSISELTRASTLPVEECPMRSVNNASSYSLEGAGKSLCVSMNSINSNGSSDSHLVEQENIVALTHDVRRFKEAVGQLKKNIEIEIGQQETTKNTVYEKLEELLQILRNILEKYPPVQSIELFMAVDTVIQLFKGHNFEDGISRPTQFVEAVDQLVGAFTNRVSEYLMGDFDSSSQTVPKTISREKVFDDGENELFPKDKDSVLSSLTPQEVDTRIMRFTDGVEIALHRAKVWSKYAKDILTYIEKRTILVAEHARNLNKLTQSMRPILQEESYLPFQSIYCTTLDQDLLNANAWLSTCVLLQGHKFMKPLSERRNEHERSRKQIKEKWRRELKQLHEVISNLQKVKFLYFQRQQEYEIAKSSTLKAENGETSKVDKKRRMEDDALQRAIEAETMYKNCIIEANKKQKKLESVKTEVLQRLRELLCQCDQTMKTVTVAYFELQHTISAAAPVQFQTLWESSRLYEPGAQYMEYVKHLSSTENTCQKIIPFTFEPFTGDGRTEKCCRSNGSLESCEGLSLHQSFEAKFSTKSKEHQSVRSLNTRTCTIMESDSDSISSFQSNKSQEITPPGSPEIAPHKRLVMSSDDELEMDQANNLFCKQPDTGVVIESIEKCTKAAETHNFKKLKTPAKCRKCDSYVYFQGVECSKCGLASHKKCLELLAIQCGHKQLPRKMTTFGIELIAYAREYGEEIPHIITKCVEEIDRRGYLIKGIYRVSGVKSKVESLCQCFENGAELVDLTEVHPNIIANVMKLYLRQLPEPLLTFRLYPDFIRIAKDYPSEKDQLAVKELRYLVQQLPHVHFTTVAYIMHHLKRITEHAEHNNMPSSNLGIVFGPTFIRTSEGSASLSSLVDTIYQARVTELLISYSDQIFGFPEVVYPDLLIDTSEVKKESSNHYAFSQESRCNNMDQTMSAVSGVVKNLINDTPATTSLQEYSFLSANSRDKENFSISKTHSADDCLGSGRYLDDEILELSLCDESHSKKSPLLPAMITSSAMGLKRHPESLPSTRKIQVQSQASATQTKVVPPPCKDISVNDTASEQEYEKESRKNMEFSSFSDTSVVNIASQTATLPSTSTSFIPLVDQKANNSNVASRPSTAELRRNFFETQSKNMPGISAAAQYSGSIDSNKVENQHSLFRPSSGSYSASTLSSTVNLQTSLNSNQSVLEQLFQHNINTVRNQEPGIKVPALESKTQSENPTVSTSLKDPSTKYVCPFTKNSSSVNTRLPHSPISSSATYSVQTKEKKFPQCDQRSLLSSKPPLEPSMRKLSCPEERCCRQLRKASRNFFSSSQEGFASSKQSINNIEPSLPRPVAKSRIGLASHTPCSFTNSSTAYHSLTSTSSQKELFQQYEPPKITGLSSDRESHFV